MATSNIPAAYLTGYLCGLRARKKGIKKAVLDLGLERVVKGSRIFAALAGGLNVLLFRATFPTMFGLAVSNRFLVNLIFGGMQSPYGALIGTGILSLLSEFLRPIHQFEPLVYGLILILTLLFLPGGLISVIKNQRR